LRILSAEKTRSPDSTIGFKITFSIKGSIASDQTEAG